jgi:hypothetical protein
MYQPGDVVTCKFFFNDDPTQFKYRPALVIQVIKPGLVFLIAQITSNDRRHELCGHWVDEKSKECKAMGLKLSSFINLSNLKTVPTNLIGKLIGKCPIMTELKELGKTRGIIF